MAVSRTWPQKPKAALPSHYYEGFLEKKGPQDKDYKKFWAGIRGLNLYFYNTNRALQYVEKIDLNDFVSLSDENPPRTVATCSVDGAGLNLKLKGQEVKLKMESLESREMWKGFLLTMVQMNVPSTLTLLPGHIYMLSEALEKEKEQRAKLDHPDPRGEKQLPNCFFRVSRTEAEVLLEKNENCGNMLLRPGGDGKSVAVTTRQKANGMVTIKHYKINIEAGEYIIDIEEPYRCTSLTEVMDFFVNSSRRILVPLCFDESYAMSLEILEMDKENGESTMVLPKTFGIPPRPQKAGVSEEKKGSPPASCLSPLPRGLPVRPTPPAPTIMAQNVYEEEDPPDQTYMNDEEVAEIRQTKPPRVFKAPPVLPTPRKFSSGAIVKKTSESAPSPKPRSFSIGMCEELERKLQERRAFLQD